jgi:hypothetical protein
MTNERLLDLLQTEELFFTHLPTFEDAKEGALTARSREHLTNWFQFHNQSSRSQAYLEVEKYQERQRDFFVNCWHMNDHESYLMWKAYAERGFAIQTTFERLQASLQASNAIVTGGTVQYVDFERDETPVGNVFNHVATKDMPYRDEREFRLVFWDVEPRNADHPKNNKGVRIKVDVKMLIRNIVRSPYFSEIPPKLEQLIERYGLGFGNSGVQARSR